MNLDVNGKFEPVFIPIFNGNCLKVIDYDASSDLVINTTIKDIRAHMIPRNVDNDINVLSSLDSRADFNILNQENNDYAVFKVHYDLKNNEITYKRP